MNDHRLIDALKETTGLTPPKYVPPAGLAKLRDMIVAGINDGSITSAAVLLAGPRGEIGWPAWGMQVAELLLAAEFLRDDLKQNMRGQGNKIMRAG